MNLLHRSHVPRNSRAGPDSKRLLRCVRGQGQFFGHGACLLRLHRGSSADYGLGIAVDGSGNAYVTGDTLSTEATFPETVGPGLTQNGYYDAFVAKVNSSGTALVYCGYIGGSSYDIGYGIAVDGSGNAYVTGETSSTEAMFPETVGPDLTQNGSYDAFVAKVNSSGTALVYCGYIGGSSDDMALALPLTGRGTPM